MSLKNFIQIASMLIPVIIGAVAIITGNPLVIKIAWISLSLFGLYMAFTTILYAIKSYQSKYWPLVYYTIHNARVAKGFKNSNTRYTVTAALKYSVNDTLYTENLNDDYNELIFNDEKDAQEYLSSFKNSSDHFIHYDPKNPEHAILKPGIRYNSVLAILIGFSLVYVGVASYLGIIVW